MADTHINAYYGAVDEATAKVAQATAELQTAEEALKAHPDYEAPKKASKNIAVQVEEPEAEAPKKASKNIAVQVEEPEAEAPKKRDAKDHFVKE